MANTADPVSKLVLELSKLPGIGEKTAMRLAYHVLRTDEASVRALAETLIDAKQKVRLCEECFVFTENPICSYCSDARRKPELICVVEKPADVMAIENSQRYFGRYHVLHGVLSPLDGVGPEQLRVRELLARIQKHSLPDQRSPEGGARFNNIPTEVILALNPTVEGEATGVYLTKLLKPLSVAVSKIAHGIPVGGVLEYIDRQTIGRAIENRIMTSEAGTASRDM